MMFQVINAEMKNILKGSTVNTNLHEWLWTECCIIKAEAGFEFFFPLVSSQHQHKLTSALSFKLTSTQLSSIVVQYYFLFYFFPFPAATRMIASALSRDSPPSTPSHRPDNRLSVTISNKSSKMGMTFLLVAAPLIPAAIAVSLGVILL